LAIIPPLCRIGQRSLPIRAAQPQPSADALPMGRYLV